jgi:hypothetical protein
MTEATSYLPQARRLPAFLTGFDLQRVSTWLLGFGLTVYLGLNGGGYDPLVSDKLEIVVWWIVVAGLLVGAFPRRRPGRLGWTALGLFAAFVGWTALSLGWTDSTDATSADLARVSGYLAIFALILFVRGSRSARLIAGAVGTGIACVTIVALLSRLHPAWFPEADQTARYLAGSRNRLAYPLNYWNAVAALAAMGIPLLLNTATTGKSVVLRGLAAAALPAMALTIFFTLSRGGVAAGVIAICVYLAFASDRLPRLGTMLVAAAGSAILIGGASQRHDLQEGLLNAAAHHQGNQVLTMTIVVCAGVGLLQAAFSLLLKNTRRPSWTVPSRATALWATAAVVVVVVIGALAANAPHHISHSWNDFKSEGTARGTARLSSFGGEGRYQLWSSAVEENSTKPLTGTGSGTFEYWWNKHGSGSIVRDTHSLYLQTLGELGIIGLALLGGFVALVLVGSGRAILRAASRGRPQLAAALASCTAFFVTAAFDWMWQIPVLPVAMLLLAGPLLTSGVRSRRSRRGRPTLQLPVRLALVAVALVAIIAIAIPLSSTSLIRQSQADAQVGNLPGALQAAASAHNAQPDAALPHLQQALVLEREGNYPAAVAQARDATRREAADWRNWFVLTRVEAEAGHPQAAVRAYRRAASLNPNSYLFNRR